MKIKVWVVTTCVPGETEPCLPSVFAIEAEAEAYAETMLREEWAANGPIDPDDSAVEATLPYPGDWRTANNQLRRHIGADWGEWQITAHELEVVGAAGPSSPEYLDRFPPEARVHADRAYQDGYEDGGNSEISVRDDLTALCEAIRDDMRLHGNLPSDAVLSRLQAAESALKSGAR